MSKDREKAKRRGRKISCKYPGGAQKGCQSSFLSSFFTAGIGWKGKVTFAMRCLGLGLCLSGSFFPSDYEEGQQSSALASAVRHECKPLPLLLASCVFSKEMKMSMQYVDTIGTCLLWSPQGVLICYVSFCIAPLWEELQSSLWHCNDVT